MLPPLGWTLSQARKSPLQAWPGRMSPSAWPGYGCSAAWPRGVLASILLMIAKLHLAECTLVVPTALGWRLAAANPCLTSWVQCWISGAGIWRGPRGACGHIVPRPQGSCLCPAGSGRARDTVHNLCTWSVLPEEVPCNGEVGVDSVDVKVPSP